MAKGKRAKKAIETDNLMGLPETREAETTKFSVSSYTLNIVDVDNVNYKFPGNISPEGYFYSPFYGVTLKELQDELQSIPTKRINFNPTKASVTHSPSTVYDPITGGEKTVDLYTIKIISPVPYKMILHQPFSIYDVMEEKTSRGYLESVNETEFTITTEAVIEESGLNGGQDPDGRSRYIICLMEENAPEYAEFIPSSLKLVWRGPKKMSELESTSPIYNMPFTNGRNYIHKNLNVFVRRQDPHAEFNLFRPSEENPLRRFQVEGGEKFDFDNVQYIIDSMVDAC